MMKKTVKGFVSILLVLTMVFALAACGIFGRTAPVLPSGGEPAATESAAPIETLPPEREPSPSAELPAPTPSESEDDPDDGPMYGKFPSVEEFVASDMIQDQVETVRESLEGSGMAAESVAEGDALVYLYTIENDALAAAMDADALQSAIDSQASMFEGIAAMLTTAVEVENPSVIVRYVDNQGNEIYSQEFLPAE